MVDRKNFFKFWKNKNVFLTGHTGFKGAWLSMMLNKLGAKVYGYSLPPLNNSLFKKANIKSCLFNNTYGDILNKKKLEKSLIKSSPQIIIHMAAQSLVGHSYNFPYETFNTNALGTLNIIESLKNLNFKKLLIVTTDKVYSNNEIKKKFFNEKDILKGSDPYSASKVCAELITDSYIQSTNLKKKIFIARSGNVIGGGDISKNRLIPDIFNYLKNNKKILIRNLYAVRPWQHVMDCLDGYLVLIYKSEINKKLYLKGSSWNFGPQSKNYKTVLDVINQVNKLSEKKITISKTKSLYKEAGYLSLDSTKSNTFLGWKPRYNFSQSIQKVYDWYYPICKNNFLNICLEQIDNFYSLKK